VENLKIDNILTTKEYPSAFCGYEFNIDISSKIKALKYIPTPSTMTISERNLNPYVPANTKPKLFKTNFNSNRFDKTQLT